ncbi:uncharacterized protein KY384_003553 [Bacidia gigantensis]|uniref:uncharacterized protein n=1 Tax=Bacidia gigantensis TaxID=2732470 RepID=UPI001D048E87|nr:uncharacterized protein KY384_003553 [Bacidia gigantensis]KAG8531917.1 hypothetical protein KY384_003553 [Bacidia gigantensis]
MEIIVAGFLVAIIFITVLLYRQHSRGAAPADDSLSEYPVPKKPARAALLLSKKGPYTLVHDWPRPQISSKEVLIRNRAIGLNPIDWKCVTYGFGVYSIPWISGREAAGVIEEIGAEVRNFRKGDRVWVTSTNYRDNRTSTFQEFIAASPFNVGHLPDFISFDEGATLGVGIVAAAGALFDSLHIPWPQQFEASPPIGTLSPTSPQPSISDQDGKPHGNPDSRPWILIWGASCVTGMMATQLAHQSNLRVLGVASLHNTSQLLGLGAEKVLDRHRPEEVIAEAQELRISLAIDCVGQETATYAARALLTGGKLAYLVKKPKVEVIEKKGLSVTDILIKRFHEDERYGSALVAFVERALVKRTLRPVKYEIIEGGLEAVEEGLRKLSEGGVSGEKLVVKVV